MGVEGLPEDPEQAIDAIASTGLLKASTPLGEVKLRSSQEIELQPANTPFGLRIKKEDNGTITPTIVFDSKKLREKQRPINAEEILDKALEEFNEAS